MNHSLHNTSYKFNNLSSFLNKIEIRRDNLLNSTDVELIDNNYMDKKNPVPILFNDLYEAPKSFDYEIIVFGILPCGSKVSIIIKDIKPYIEIKYNPEINRNENLIYVKKLLKYVGIKNYKLSLTSGKDLMYYNENISKYIKIKFDKLIDRQNFINYLNNNEIKSYNNELSCYYRLVGREYKINLSEWNIIKNYKFISENYNIYKCKYNIEVSINDIESYNYELEHKFNDIDLSLLKKDKSISLCFDIEMYSSTGDIPNGNNPNDILFMICFTCQFINDDDYGLNVCITCSPCDAQKDLFTIICKDEKEVIKLFGILIGLIQPEFITEFNGSQFDWKVLIEKAIYYNILRNFVESMSIKKIYYYETENDEKINTFLIKTEKIKIESDRNAYSYNINVHGYIPFDTRIILQQINPNGLKSSLNYFLEKYKLNLKDDMEIKEMFRIFKEGTSGEMAKVAHYCFVDSFSLHKLLKKINFIQDRRELSKISYVNMFDGIYRANGVKLKNLIVSNCIDLNLKYSNIVFDHEKDEMIGKYPGAFVLNPKRGQVSSLYNIHEFNEKYNLIDKNEMIFIQIIVNENFDIIYLEKKIPKITNNLYNDFLNHYINYLKENEQKYPILALDFASLYPSLSITYNLSPEYLIKKEDKHKYEHLDLYKIDFKYGEKNIVAYTVRHNNNKELFGVIPSIFIDLGSKRKAMKNKLAYYQNKKNEYDNNNVDITNKEYIDSLFNITYYNTKQLILKIFMNSIYGELGNKTSPLSLVEIAGGITTAGRYNLNLIKSFIENKGFTVYYGDSVIGSTPIIIRYNNNIMIIEIQNLELYNYSKYKKTLYGKEILDLNYDELEVYTDEGWTKIIRKIRHKTKKRLYKVITLSGSVIVTEDHSLLTNKNTIIKPHVNIIGTKLLTWKRLNFNIINYNSKMFFVYGMICKNGITLDDKFFIYSNNKEYLIKGMNIYNAYNIESKLKLKYNSISNSYKLESIGNVKGFINTNYKLFCNLGNKTQITNKIINSDLLCKSEFINGYLHDNKNDNIIVNSQILAQGFYLILNDLGYYCRILCIDDNYKIIISKKKINNSNKVIKVIDLGYSERYVYDLETINHKFNAGVGNIIVHNTDSLYISPNKENFKYYDRLYYSHIIDKLNYSSSLIKKTIDIGNEFQSEVNNYLINDNGSPYLKMAYEETLFPTIFLAKKKYFGLPHVNEPNFKNNKLFIRGLEVIKRGSSKILIDVCIDIMNDSTNIDNFYTIKELVKDKIKFIFNNKWDIKDFIKSAKYNPNKNNVPVLSFINRMKELNKVIPEPYDRFEYVVIKKYPYKYDLQGRQTEIKQGDKMEYVETVKENDYKIDLLYYFERQILAQFARLITYDNDFTEYLDDVDINEYNLDDDKIFKNAKEYIKEISNQYSDKLKNKGKIFKSLYKKVCNTVKSNNIYNDNNINKFLTFQKEENLDYTNILDFINKNVNLYIDNNFHYNAKKIIEVCKNRNKYTYKQVLSKIYVKKNLYNLTFKEKINSLYDEKVNKLIRFINENDLFDKIINIDNIIKIIIDNIKNKYNIDNKILDNNIDDLEQIIDDNKLKNVSNELLNFHSTNIDSKIVLLFYNNIVELANIKQIINERIDLCNEINYILLNSVKDIKPNNFNSKYKIFE